MLLGWFSSDTSEGDDSGVDDEDEDVAFEARRVERMEGMFAAGGDEEVVLRGLRKVYSTKQASIGVRIVLMALL